MTTANTPTTHLLDVPDGSLYYEVRGSGPLLFVVGAPMDASYFAPLADHLAAQHTVVTIDPRGINRSPLRDPATDSTPELRADDLHRITAELGTGPAAVFGTSGGAITGLALAIEYPDDVHTLVAHEPPLVELLADRDAVRAEVLDICETYRRDGQGPAFMKFMALVSGVGPDAEPDPEVMAMMAAMPEPSAREIADGNYMLAHMLRPTSLWVPDLERLRAVPARVVIGVGEASTGTLCERTSSALIEALGVERAAFPGDHDGFVPEPAGFAATLRDVVAAG